MKRHEQAHGALGLFVDSGLLGVRNPAPKTTSIHEWIHGLLVRG